MKITAANKIPDTRLNHFIKRVERQIEKTSLREEGFVLELNNEIKGCFVLSSLNADVYWLKQLYIDQEVALKLPVLLETVVTIAKGMNAKKVFVHSHQPLVDNLLEALQFNRQKDDTLPVKKLTVEGNWWAYDVS